MKHCCRGFTLVEVVVAVLITGLLLTGVYGVFGTVSSARERLEQEGIVYHQARIFFDRIGGELSSMRLTTFGTRTVLEAGTTVYGTPYLEFNTELSSPLQQRRGGLTRVRYELGAVDNNTMTLYRSEQRLLVDLAASEPLAFVTGLKDFQIRYYAEGIWHDQWLSAGAPQLVEIEFEMEGAAGINTPFRSSFILSGGRG